MSDMISLSVDAHYAIRRGGSQSLSSKKPIGGFIKALSEERPDSIEEKEKSKNKCRDSIHKRGNANNKRQPVLFITAKVFLNVLS